MSSRPVLSPRACFFKKGAILVHLSDYVLRRSGDDKMILLNIASLVMNFIDPFMIIIMTINTVTIQIVTTLL